jgi:putative membrane fusion protein
MEIVVGKYGTIGDEIAVNAVVLNEEITFYAPCEGHFENMVKENDKVRKNELVGNFITASQEKKPMLATTPGIFTTRTDGLEKVFSSFDFETATSEVFHYKLSTGRQLPDHSYTGNPIYKIVNNLRPTRLLIHFPQRGLKTKINPSQRVEIVYNDLKFSNAKIIHEKKISKEIILLVELNDFCPNMIDKRYIDSKCIFNMQSGYLLPQKTIVTKDSTKGIYCVKGQDVNFKPIRVLKSENEMVLVKGLDANDMVIAHPGFFLRYIK